ncbi:hypothetical protein ACLOJK_006681 [Asimina triloba]
MISDLQGRLDYDSATLKEANNCAEDKEDDGEDLQRWPELMIKSDDGADNVVMMRPFRQAAWIVGWRVNGGWMRGPQRWLQDACDYGFWAWEENAPDLVLCRSDFASAASSCGDNPCDGEDDSAGTSERKARIRRMLSVRARLRLNDRLLVEKRLDELVRMR